MGRKPTTPPFEIRNPGPFGYRLRPRFADRWAAFHDNGDQGWARYQSQSSAPVVNQTPGFSRM